MKKISLILSVIGLAACLSACHHDSDSYCDAGFADGCQDGEYVYCHYEKKDSRGVVKAEATIEFNNIVYICDGRDVLVPRDYSCTGGVLNKNGSPVADNVFCMNDAKLISCEGDDVVTGYQVCNENARVFCEADANGAYHVQKDSCGVKVCENYERENNIYALCLNAGDVESGCGNDVTAYGKCDSDSVLTFCTRKDASKGKTIKLNCPARDQDCMLINDEYGYDCTNTCSDTGGLYTVNGTCENGKLVYCDKKDDGSYVVTEWDCPNDEHGPLTCGFADYQYNCI